MEEQIVKLYVAGISGVKIAQLLNIPIWKVYEYLKSGKIPRRSNRFNSRRYTLDNYYFSSIDNRYNAYWLGFLYADGHVSPNQDVMSVSCKLSDIDHLDKLKIDLHSNYPIHSYKANTEYGYVEYARFKVVSKQIVKDLILHGCVANKSLILKPPPYLSQDLEKDFIRGYNDGDGCITVADKNGTPKLSMVGTLEFLKWVHERLPSPGHIYPDKRKPYIYQYRSVGRSALINIGWLYCGAKVYLERKNERAMELLAEV